MCGIWSGVEIRPSCMLLISVPHPLGRGSKKHSWWICHRRTLYWWRRQPHHQKSNHHWISCFSWNLAVLLFVCCSVISWNRKQENLYFSLLLPTDHSESNKTNRYPAREKMRWRGNGEGLLKKVEDKSFVNSLPLTG